MGTSLISSDQNPEVIQRNHNQHYIQSWSVQATSLPRVIENASGSWFQDSSGKRYLDFESQLVNLNLGHQHPEIIAAIKEQAERCCYIGPAMANDVRGELAALLAHIMPGDLERTFFTTGGANANESAVRLARQYTGRHKVITRYRSYHGSTALGLGLSGDPRRWSSEPSPPGIVRMLDPYAYRCPTVCHRHPNQAGEASCAICTGAHLEELLQYENPDTVAAVLLEPVTGTNGILYPPDGYLQKIRQLCEKFGILLIADEIMVGFGRTGKWFACDHWGVVPDIMTTAKGINSGYVPLGAMTVSRPISDWLTRNPFPSGMTYAGHPLACASALATIRIYERDRLIDKVARDGERMRQLLVAVQDRHPSLGEVRGKGLFFGLELVKNRHSREPLVPFNAKGKAAAPMQEVLKAAMESGLYLSAFSNVIRIAPPLTISDEDLHTGCAIIDQVLTIADNYTQP